MPLIDVTDILFDTDIAGQVFTVYRRKEVVNAYGESVVKIKVIPNQVGSIQPSGDQTVIREGEYDAQNQQIKICCVFRLRGVTRGPGGKTYKPDRIAWGGNLYEVTSPNEWEDFGRGFIEADAIEVNWTDFPPQFRPGNVGQLVFSRPANSGFANGAGGVG